MNPLLTLVVSMAIVTWILVVLASLIRARAWTPAGLQAAFGNRADLGEPTAFAGRAERTARNALENLVLFAAIALTAQAAGLHEGRVLLGAQLFFWARMVYIPLYYAGIPYLRTASWMASVAGLGTMLSAML
jgi:uncharacterized MAPEG superfamily protein